MKVNITFGDKERVFGDHARHVLIVGDAIVNRGRGQLHMKLETWIDIFIHIQTHPVAAAEVLQRRGDVIPGASLNISPKSEVSTELEPVDRERTGRGFLLGLGSYYIALHGRRTSACRSLGIRGE